MATEMNKTYNPSEIEDRLYKKWLDKKYFHAEVDRSKKPFTIVMPPPNITGQLHMGHALDNTLQDILIRFKRMQGYNALWQPGTDHASIATEVKVTNKLREEGIDKEELGREGFLKRTWEWREEYGGRIVSQLKKLGSSADWDRERFTMDEGCSKAVKEVFVNLYNKGLIYQGSRIINWCPHCITALSDAEVEHAEQAGHFWHIKYPIKDSDDYVIIATTRPETLFGDTAVAVNPEDERYKDLVGKMLVLPLVGREIPVIADEYVDKEFGTGCVKITPAHDPNDFEVGQRHNLAQIKVMNDDATMNSYAGKYEGMDRYECRKAMVKDLEDEGLLVKVEDHSHNVGQCYRCGTTVEPIVSKQWFVKMKPLAQPAIDAVKNGDTQFVPEHFEKVYFHWLENIRDWCISRQLWWGHRIPAFYCDDCGEIVVTKEDSAVCPKCGKEMRQDPDTLDTWFSSALWPFSTLGWPDKTEELDYFYPTSVLVTGYDIIPFWVMRMMFSALEHTGEVPFKHVFIHGLVRDSQGRKMSKSLGNGIDPLVIIDEYGADTLRYCLLNGISAGNDIRFSPEKLEGCRNFVNKIWNASRFVIMNCEGKNIKTDIDEVKLNSADKWILSRLNTVVRDVTLNMEKYEIGLACAALQDFVWSDFCDWYIELCKPVLYGDDEEKKNDSASALSFVLGQTLKLLHPFIPFVTEEIYSYLPTAKGKLIRADFPKYEPKFAFRKDRDAIESVKEIVKAIRNIKSETGAAPSAKVDVYVVTEKKKLVENGKIYLNRLANVKDVKFVSSKDEIGEKTVSKILAGFELYVPLGELVDYEKELARLKSELEKAESEIARANGKLNNAGFVSKAPKALIDGEKAKVAKFTDIKEKILAGIKELQN